MDIEQLYSAVDLVRASGHRGNTREASFMRAYPVLLTTARLPVADPVADLLRATSLVHAWLPGSPRFEAPLIETAAEALRAAKQESTRPSIELVEPIADCLCSVIGAAWVLHLANPAAFPMWGRRVEHFRLQAPPSSYHMNQVRNYMGFIEETQGIAAHPLFLTFHHQYCTAYQARLQRLRIPAYPLTETRVIESAAAELAGRD